MSEENDVLMDTEEAVETETEAIERADTSAEYIKEETAPEQIDNVPVDLTSATREEFSDLISKTNVKMNIKKQMQKLFDIASEQSSPEVRYAKLLQEYYECQGYLEFTYRKISGRITVAKMLGREEELYAIELSCLLIEAFDTYNNAINTEGGTMPTARNTPTNIFEGMCATIVLISKLYNFMCANHNIFNVDDVATAAQYVRDLTGSIEEFYKDTNHSMLISSGCFASEICHRMTWDRSFAELVEAML